MSLRESAELSENQTWVPLCNSVSQLALRNLSVEAWYACGNELTGSRKRGFSPEVSVFSFCSRADIGIGAQNELKGEMRDQ